MHAYHYCPVKIGPDNYSSSGININDFCFLHSGQYACIAGHRKCSVDSNDPDLYLAVKSDKRTIYLKYHTGTNVADSAGLSYNNLYRLGLLNLNKREPSIRVSKSNYFMYMWMNGDSGMRLSFRLAVFGAVTALVSIVADVVSVFLK